MVITRPEGHALAQNEQYKLESNRIQRGLLPISQVRQQWNLIYKAMIFKNNSNNIIAAKF